MPPRINSLAILYRTVPAILRMVVQHAVSGSPAPVVLNHSRCEETLELSKVDGFFAWLQHPPTTAFLLPQGDVGCGGKCSDWGGFPACPNSVPDSPLSLSFPDFSWRVTPKITYGTHCLAHIQRLQVHLGVLSRNHVWILGGSLMEYPSIWEVPQSLRQPFPSLQPCKTNPAFPSQARSTIRRSSTR